MLQRLTNGGGYKFNLNGFHSRKRKSITNYPAFIAYQEHVSHVRGTTKSSAAGSHRAFVTATSRPLQAKKDEESTAEACKGVTEAAESVKDGARSVKNAAETVTKMTKEVTKKVSETAETITDKAASVIKDKIVGK